MTHGIIKQLISYVIPMQVEKRSSSHNACLEVLISNGRYILDSAKTNYSFGGLHKIFRKAFRDVKIDSFSLSNCLLLGLGGGSVIQILRKEYSMMLPITAVEIDPVVIELGQKYFNFNFFHNVKIVNTDALNHVKSTSAVYDLIIIDVYRDDMVPEAFHTEEFIAGLKSVSHSSTVILFNKMISGENALLQYEKLLRRMSGTFTNVVTLTYKMNRAENKVICVNAFNAHPAFKKVLGHDIEISVNPI
jgi:spermidine synthase